MHVYAVLFFVVCLGAVLTWIIPAGKFDTVKDPVSGITTYVPDSFHLVDRNPQNIWDVFLGIFNGWTSSSALIFAMFAMGAWIKILEDTGMIKRSFNKLITAMAGKEKFAITIIMLVMMMFGSIGVKPTIPLLPIAVVLAISLGYDGMVALIMMHVGNGLGFSLGPYQIQSVGIAHEVAGLPRFSGAGVRWGIMIAYFVMMLVFVFRYMDSIKKDPSKSLATDMDASGIDLPEIAEGEHKPTVSDIINIILNVIGFVVLIYGVAKWNWGPRDYGTLFLVMGVATGIVAKMGINGISESFVKGCQGIVYSALILGIAAGIAQVLNAGNIIDSIVYYLSKPLENVSPVLGANLMFVINGIIDFFIPSNAGQAAAIMPIMTPIADLTNVTRQVAVEAYQLGGGLVDMIIPTSFSLFACLGITGVPYKNYLKWYMPIFALQCVLAVVLLTVLQIIQWGPF
jgi:uncharacterized ion transporter superfamily protein YfcC